MLKKRDIERITNTLDSYFYYYAWEGVTYVKRQLKGISGELSINNRELLEYVWEGSDRALAVCILYQMGQSLISSFWGTHPVLQDYMADKLERFREVVNGIGRTWRKVMHPQKVSLSRMFDDPIASTKVSELKEEHLRQAYKEVKKEWKKVQLPPELTFERQYNLTELESE